MQVCKTPWCNGGTATTRWASSSPAGFLGMMYYFIPKQAERPVYSLPLVHRALLGADLHVHVGGPAPPALHRLARLDAVAGHGVLTYSAGA